VSERTSKHERVTTTERPEDHERADLHERPIPKERPTLNLPHWLTWEGLWFGAFLTVVVVLLLLSFVAWEVP